MCTDAGAVEERHPEVIALLLSQSEKTLPDTQTAQRMNV
jgi:hypothetical protein